VIEASDSGDEREGYVLFTASPDRNVIDQRAVVGNEPRDSCVVIRQGAHHVIVRGLVLANCKTHGVYLERQAEPPIGAKTHDIVIEENEIRGWGGSGRYKAGMVHDDAAVYCGYYRETQAARKPDRIIVQRNRIHSPRHSATPWQLGAGPRTHPEGPQGVNFNRCGSNHVVRYNEIYSTNGNYYNDGIGGAENFSTEGFPWADSDIYGNRVSHVYDDAIEAEGANRNVRIWGNYLDVVLTAIANAPTAVGPLYVWRNVSNRMGGMYNPGRHPDVAHRGAFIKGGSRHETFNGGRAYYFHNTVLQPSGQAGSAYPMGAGSGIESAGGRLYNVVSRNNVWHIHKPQLIQGELKFYSIRTDADIDADFDLHNGMIFANGTRRQRHGSIGVPIYATSGRHYPDLAARPGDFSLKSMSPGYRAAEPIPNFNDAFGPTPDVGAHQSGTLPLEFGVDAYRRGKPGQRPPL
jgi:hypothetical protein